MAMRRETNFVQLPLEKANAIATSQRLCPGTDKQGISPILYIYIISDISHMSPLFGGLEIHGVLHQNAGFLVSSVRLPYPLDQATPRQPLACRMGLLPRHGHFPVDQLARGEPQGFILVVRLCLVLNLGASQAGCWGESVGSYPSWKRQDWLGQIFKGLRELRTCKGQRPPKSRPHSSTAPRSPKRGLIGWTLEDHGSCHLVSGW